MDIIEYIKTGTVNKLFRDTNRGLRYKNQFFANYLDKDSTLINSMSIIIQHNTREYYILPVQIISLRKVTESNPDYPDDTEFLKLNIRGIGEITVPDHEHCYDFKNRENFIIYNKNEFKVLSLEKLPEDEFRETITEIAVRDLGIETPDDYMDLLQESYENLCEKMSQEAKKYKGDNE